MSFRSVSGEIPQDHLRNDDLGDFSLRYASFEMTFIPLLSFRVKQEREIPQMVFANRNAGDSSLICVEPKFQTSESKLE
jgi:hypothetical protein